MVRGGDIGVIAWRKFLVNTGFELKWRDEKKRTRRGKKERKKERKMTNKVDDKNLRAQY
jgi:hypothetical protein